MNLPAHRIDSFLASLAGQTLRQAAASAADAGFFVASARLLGPKEPFRLDRVVLAMDDNGLVRAASIR